MGRKGKMLELTHAATSEDLLASSLTRPLLEKFDKYWRDCCLVLAIAVVMDPRFKMKLVEFSFSKIYGEGGEAWTKMVDDATHELFLEYITLTLPEATTFEEVAGNDNDSKTETEMPEPDGASLLSSADGCFNF
ncbi:hAT-like transposase, RNase-H fold [Dillenia turbinata]|uniref:HAT-like transposase, RNase-H fold n=1 Tax=Dillenia turbinata TaxID=194707 RepID=A0AAN8UJ99_9MAGN